VITRSGATSQPTFDIRGVEGRIRGRGCIRDRCIEGRHRIGVHCIDGAAAVRGRDIDRRARVRAHGRIGIRAGVGVRTRIRPPRVVRVARRGEAQQPPRAADKSAALAIGERERRKSSGWPIGRELDDRTWSGRCPGRLWGALGAFGRRLGAVLRNVTLLPLERTERLGALGTVLRNVTLLPLERTVLSRRRPLLAMGETYVS